MMIRKLLFVERLLLGDGISPFNAIAPIRIKGSFPVVSLTKALKKLQQKHLLLNAFVANDEHAMPYFMAHPTGIGPEIPIRMVARLSDNDWQRESVNEWAVPFNTDNGPLMRVVWIKGEAYSELLLVIHHCLCDGGSFMSIMASLLQLLDDGNANIAKEETILSIRDIVPESILNSKKKQVKAKLMGTVTNLVLWLMPVKKKLVERKKDYMIHWKLEKSTSDMLILKCKSESVTVNTALCMALLLAFKSVRKASFHNKVSCPVDIRRFAPKIRKDNIFAFGLMFVVSVDKASGFFDHARKMQKDIDQKTAKLNAYDTIMMMEASHASLNNFTNFLKYGKSVNDCMFSNLGRIAIPHQYQSFTVDTIFSPSVIGPLGNTTTMITSTYRGQMDFTFIASEGFIRYEEAIDIKDKMLEIIMQQL